MQSVFSSQTSPISCIDGMKVWLQALANHLVSFLIVFLPVAWLVPKVFGGIAIAVGVSALVYLLGVGLARILFKDRHGN